MTVICHAVCVCANLILQFHHVFHIALDFLFTFWCAPLPVNSSFRYHMDDVVIGKIYFLLVRIKIKHMEVQVLRRESTGSGPNTYNETDVLTKFEIMDGAPMRGESIPLRLFLSPFDLTPTYKNVHGKFNVKYYLNLVLVDEEERRYFKQQEIQIWRKELKKVAE